MFSNFHLSTGVFPNMGMWKCLLGAALLSPCLLNPPAPRPPLRRPTTHPSDSPCQHQHTQIPLENKCLLRTRAGVHLRPAQVDTHEALGVRPGETDRKELGVCSTSGGSGVFWKGVGVREGGWLSLDFKKGSLSAVCSAAQGSAPFTRSNK